MTKSAPPDIEDEEAYHRDENEGIVFGLSERLAGDDALVPGDLVEGGHERSVPRDEPHRPNRLLAA
jgi:hypothetical protein